MDIGQGLTSAWGAIASFVPKLVGFLLILVIGWLIAKFVGRMVGKALGKVGLDRALDRGGVGQYLQRSRFSASELTGKVVYYIGLLIVLQLSFSVFGANNPITQLLNSVVAWIPQAVIAIVIVVVAAMIAKAVRDVVSSALGGLSYGRLLANVAGVFILALGAIAALNQIGVATTVTQPVLIAVLATVGGILVVGVGGGMIQPMQQRWAGWLDVAERETGRLRNDESYQRGRGDAMAQPSTAQEGATPTQPSASHAQHTSSNDPLGEPRRSSNR